ncbi:MYND-type domain-containing protein [Favolaschia claudopus]|uniref:MYND-type domain-containing protein n=1 Tax=Favolaschia claudopus TaxID=2862362 RepID=A0AAV9Z6I7_9AGAR
MQQERVPPLPARLGLACYKCYKEENVRLSRCSGSLIDWKNHKPMCKALSSIEKEPMAMATLFFSLPSEPTTDLNVLKNMTEAYGSNILNFCHRSLNRKATTAEFNLVGWEPRCMVCTRTNQLIRMEAAKNGTSSAKIQQLIPCPQCNVSFCCSPAHWEAARLLHDRPCEDAPGPDSSGLSQCEMNRQVRTDVNFENTIAESHTPTGTFMWAPDRVLARWSSLEGKTWDGEFGDEMRKSVGVPTTLSMGPWVRGASDNLTMPMTILYGLEKMNEGDDGWTKKHTLTVHILGASTKELTGAMGFEEILHRLPEIKTLKLVLCGPEMPGGRIPQTITMETCPDCTRRGRKRIHEHACDTYHAFVQNKGTKYEKPDLCIAFNSGASQESIQTWPATFKLLVERKVPSLFTAYNREEAEAEAAILRSAGAKLLSPLGPNKNPWGSGKVIPEPNSVYGFYAVNGWLAGGFK